MVPVIVTHAYFFVMHCFSSEKKPPVANVRVANNCDSVVHEIFIYILLF